MSHSATGMVVASCMTRQSLNQYAKPANDMTPVAQKHSMMAARYERCLPLANSSIPAVYVDVWKPCIHIHQYTLLSYK